jgi:hypothetical protein
MEGKHAAEPEDTSATEGKHAAEPADSPGPPRGVHRLRGARSLLRSRLAAVTTLVLAVGLGAGGTFLVNGFRDEPSTPVMQSQAYPPLIVAPSPSGPSGPSGPPAPTSPAPTSVPGGTPTQGTVPAQPPPDKAAPPQADPPAPKPTVSPLTAKYVIKGTWDSGFLVEVTVANPTGSDLPWRVKVDHASSASVGILRSWSTQSSTSGSALIFTGPLLAAGGAQTFGFEATKKTPSAVRPTHCVINDAPCVISG